MTRLRPTLLLLIALGLPSLLPAGALAADPLPACVDTAGVVTMRSVALVRAFDPFCAAIDSGERVLWRNADNFPHLPQSDEGSGGWGTCFDASEQHGLVLPGAEYAVRFVVVDGHVRSEWRSPAGGVDVRDCDDAIEPRLSDADTVVLRYRCEIHPGQMKGLVAIRLA